MEGVKCVYTDAALITNLGMIQYFNEQVFTDHENTPQSHLRYAL